MRLDKQEKVVSQILLYVESAYMYMFLIKYLFFPIVDEEPLKNLDGESIMIRG